MCTKLALFTRLFRNAQLTKHKIYICMYVCMYVCVCVCIYIYIYIYILLTSYIILVGRDFLPVQTGPGAHRATCTMGTPSFPGLKYGRGVLLTAHPILVPQSWKGRAIPLPTLWACNGITHWLRHMTQLLFF